MAITENRLKELDAMEQAATKGPWRKGIERLDTVISDGSNGNEVTDEWYGGKLICETGHSTDVAFIVIARTAVPELIAEVRRLRECLETLAHITSFSGDHPNSHVWAYIMGEALQADPKESPFWQSDEVPHD